MAINLFMRDMLRLSVDLEANEGVTEGIRRAFVVYLAGHNRPIHEVLFPNLRNIEQEFRETFVGLTAEEVTLDTLQDARNKLLRTLHDGLDGNERQFLVSVARNPSAGRRASAQAGTLGTQSFPNEV